MSRKGRIFSVVGLFCGLLGALAISLPVLQGESRKPTSGKLIVHEWGTFTSFAGSDGVNLEFRPLVTNDLPRFIMTPTRQPGTPASLFLKDQFVAFQRMETPVTYFYTDVPRSVKARVDFPRGMLTEWYPVVKGFESGKPEEKRAMGGAFLDWGTVRLTPPADFAAVRVRNGKGEPIPATLPAVAQGDHYGRARETDSAIVETVDARKGSHFEKFLFYRGIGNFDLPIKLVALGNDRFQISNTGSKASGALILVQIANEHARFAQLKPIAGHTDATTSLPTTESTIDELADATVRALIAAGLYEKEARAMVNTWRTSWFEENGTRLFYLVPEKLTNELLPLTIEPAPEQQVRVLVGRLETLTPEDGARLTAALVRIDSNDPLSADSIKDQLKPLGRFAEPAVQFLITQTQASDAREHLETILRQLRERK
jgi:hypothetical protein